MHHLRRSGLTAARARPSQRVLYPLLAGTAALLALSLRLQAVDRLPIDADEDDYLRAAQQIAASIETRDWARLTHLNYRPEHPMLAKIVYGIALSLLPPAPEVPDRSTAAPPASALPQPHLTVGRLVAAAFGALEVLALALVDPLAGLFLAVQTFTVKYTAQMMLEAQPAFTSLVAVLAYRRSKRQPGGWWILSALALGLTLAAKYPYGIAGVSIALDWLWPAFPGAEPPRSSRSTRHLAMLAGWALVAAAVFFAADPYLWPDPLGRLRPSMFYHGSYARSETVRSHAQPFWQPLGWLKGSVDWQPGVFAIAVDPLISILALVGLRRLYRTQRVFALWGILALGFLLAWPTKWPHYVLLLTAPLALAAAAGLRQLVPGRPTAGERITLGTRIGVT